MLKSDRLVIVSGLVVVLIAIALAYITAEPLPPGGQTGVAGPSTVRTVRWTVASGSLEPVAGQDTLTQQVEVTAQNLTVVTFTLSWADDEPVPTPLNRDVLAITVDGPAPGTYTFEPAATASGDTGELMIRVTVNPVPTNTTATATELAALDSSLGSGTWTVEVEVTPNPLRDRGNAWELSVDYQYYRATLDVSAETEG